MLRLEVPGIGDGKAAHALVAACPPLDLNSTYAYLLLCSHFAQTCVIARQGGRAVGFVSAYRPPERQETIFVWQVAVAAAARGQGLARRMLRELLARPAVRGCRYLETTVTPSNAPSTRLFRGLAAELGAPLDEKPLFTEEDFGAERHEAEMLFRVGPFGAQPRKERAPHEP
ncbi:MAG TPA: diaminobutyrate acetyltransferase [Burkholderiales bacterium]